MYGVCDFATTVDSAGALLCCLISTILTNCLMYSECLFAIWFCLCGLCWLRLCRGLAPRAGEGGGGRRARAVGGYPVIC